MLHMRTWKSRRTHARATEAALFARTHARCITGRASSSRFSRECNARVKCLSLQASVVIVVCEYRMQHVVLLLRMC